MVNEGKLIGVIYGDYSKIKSTPPVVLKDGKMAEWRTKLIKILKAVPKGNTE